MTIGDFKEACNIVHKDRNAAVELYQDNYGHYLYIIQCESKTIKELVNAGFILTMRRDGRLEVEK